jgi:hypothetical protein
MGDSIQALIEDYKNGNKEIFLLIADKMEPLISKYVRLLYKDEKEDMHSEFVLCLLEAVNAMGYYQEEGQCIYFLSRALKNKFLELYKKSKLHYDSEIVAEDEFFSRIDSDKAEYEDFVFQEDLKELIRNQDGKQYDILLNIIFKDEPDAVIAKKNQVSRQYVNRVRKNFYQLLKETYFK